MSSLNLNVPYSTQVSVLRARPAPAAQVEHAEGAAARLLTAAVGAWSGYQAGRPSQAEHAAGAAARLLATVVSAWTEYKAGRPLAAATLRAATEKPLAVWRKRRQMREELRFSTDRDLADMGLRRGDADYETAKPFWRA